MVKVFVTDTPLELESKINKWIEGNDHTLIDIKFTTSVCYCVDSMVYIYSAMILYEEN